MNSGFAVRFAAGLLLVVFGFSAWAVAAPASKAQNKATNPPLMPAEQAAASMSVPSGFHVSLFASEPVIHQPIGIATDSRGRLWIAENNTYSDAKVNFDLTQHDRIIVLEDTNHDGRADKHTVFWDQGQKLTSVEIGFGGVWALCPPQLLFIPDRNGDDVPDGKPEVVLDGFDDGVVRHNIANGLRWGPDGWLYGRHGIQANSYVGPPGSLPSERTQINCCIWRYHPTRKLFEVGLPRHHQFLGHGLERIRRAVLHQHRDRPPVARRSGAHYQRMYGEDDNPHVYELLGQTADHFHWDTAEHWSDIRKIGVSRTTDQAGGGHAHVGLLIYQGDNWPSRYRGTLFTINLHGRRLNNDLLERQGSGYVGRHGPDFLKCADPWFRGLDLISGSDGGVYVSDWSDTGECHGADGVDRSSGRIYKVVYGQPPQPKFADISKLSDRELIALHAQRRQLVDVRAARLALQERFAAGRPMHQVHAGLRTLFDTDPDPLHKLRAMWCLYVTGGASDAWLLSQLTQPDEHLRVWSVRLLGDGKPPTSASVRALQIGAR